MTLCWVIGSGGLLGSALLRELQAGGQAIYRSDVKFDWSDAARLREQFDAELSKFAAQVPGAGAWEIYWAAGVGTMGSTAAELSNETAAWGHLLDRLAGNALLATTPGRIALASSAGAIYAGLRVNVIDERCMEAPTTPYALAKLEQERRLRAFAERGLQVAALAARISTLYGVGQALGKRQGLIAHMARSIVRNRPIQIFVPFDTVRDYITAGDAAALMVLALHSSAGTGLNTRIVASERPTTIAEIVATFRRVARRPPLIATSASPLSSLYLRRVQFRSTWSVAAAHPRTSLAIGIAQVLAAERLAQARC